MDAFKFSDRASALVESHSVSKGQIILTGRYLVEVFNREGKFIESREGHNDIVDVGLDYCLDVTFANAAQLNPFFIALINNSPAPALDAADTMASHGGWNEFVGYDETIRQDWTEGLSSGQSMTNAVSADFTINAGATLFGIFLTSANDKNGSTGTLWSTAGFSGTLTVVSTNVVKVTYTVNAA